jgi:hypothetical protein
MIRHIRWEQDCTTMAYHMKKSGSIRYVRPNKTKQRDFLNRTSNRSRCEYTFRSESSYYPFKVQCERCNFVISIGKQCARCGGKKLAVKRAWDMNGIIWAKISRGYPDFSKGCGSDMVAGIMAWWLKVSSSS